MSIHPPEPPFDCGCDCCERWSERFSRLGARLAHAAMRLVDDLLRDPRMVNHGRAVTSSTPEDDL